MILDSTVRKIQVVLAEAKTTNDCPVVASWFDSGTTPSGGPSLSNTNGTTAVDIVSAPASGYIRQVNELTVQNADTVSHTVTVRYNDNATLYTIIKATLAPGYTLTYSKSLGWAVMSPTGLFVAGQIPGTATNDDAAAGMVGEYVDASLAVGGAIPLTTNTPADVLSLSLTPGDWNVWGSIGLVLTGSTTTVIRAWLSTTSATDPAAPNGGAYLQKNYGTSAPEVFYVETIGMKRQKISATQNIYLSTSDIFTGTALTAFGFVAARRIR